MTRSRSIAEQSLEQLGGPTGILARQRADHARLARLMAQARNTEQDHQAVNDMVAVLDGSSAADPGHSQTSR